MEPSTRWCARWRRAASRTAGRLSGRCTGYCAPVVGCCCSTTAALQRRGVQRESDAPNSQTSRPEGSKLEGDEMPLPKTYGVEPHSEKGYSWATVDELPGCFATGRDMDELEEALAEA